MEEKAVSEIEQQEAEVKFSLSREQIEQIEKNAKKKGVKKGVISTILVILGVSIVAMTVSLVIQIATGRFMVELRRYFNTGGIDASIIDDKTIDKSDMLYSIIRNKYIDEVEPEQVRDGIYKGIMESLGDPYSVYYTKEEFDDMMESSSGVYYGIGAYLQQDTDTMLIKIVRPIPGTPAEEVGLMPEDIVMEVNGEDITGQDINVVVSQIRGEEGTTVDLGIARSGEEDLLHFTVERRRVESITVESEMLEDNIGYIAIAEFEDVTKGQFNTEFDKLNEEGMEALILDLRDNPGGYVDVAVDIADRLLPEGLVVYTLDKYGNKDEYKSDAENYFDKPLIVLVNGNSASASEILSGAIKDYKAGKLLGTTTFGKGIVQEVLPIGDGSGAKITESKYYTPSGNNIHEIGIEPDVELELDVEAYLEDGMDNQKNEAIKILKEELGKAE